MTSKRGVPPADRIEARVQDSRPRCETVLDRTKDENAVGSLDPSGFRGATILADEGFANSGAFDRLMVIIPDRLSELLKKGEVTARYYNPGNLFSEVHIVMTNDDAPEPEQVQPMVGKARLVLHNLPTGWKLFAQTLGWNRLLLQDWVSRGVALAATIRPKLIRTHGTQLNSYLAREIKRSLGLPYITSIHTDAEKNPFTSVRPWQQALKALALTPLELRALRDANAVLPVYQAIVGYLEAHAIPHVEVAYNVINPINLRPKSNYQLHDPVRIVCVSRQIRGKDPSQLVRAVARMPNVHLTLIGEGTHHDKLRRLAAAIGKAEQFEFTAGMSNDDLCRRLPDFDIFAAHCDYPGIPKAILEALLTGLPTVINRISQNVMELTPEICMLVANTADGYQSALETLIAHHEVRECLGRAAKEVATRQWHPMVTETRYVEIYLRLLKVKNNRIAEVSP